MAKIDPWGSSASPNSPLPANSSPPSAPSRRGDQALGEDLPLEGVDGVELHELVRVAGVAIDAAELAAAVGIDGPLERHAAGGAVQEATGGQLEVSAELRKTDRKDWIAIGTATDPYQPAERRFEVTREILKVFAAGRGRRLSVTTKSDLVVRDLDLFREIARANVFHVNFTLTTMDQGLARLLEPRAARRAPRVADRFRAPPGAVRHPGGRLPEPHHAAAHRRRG